MKVLKVLGVICVVLLTGATWVAVAALAVWICKKILEH